MSQHEPYELREPDRSLGELIGDLTSELSDLIRTHIDLARTEIREDARQGLQALAFLAIGALAGLIALLMLSMAAAWGLAETMDEGWAYLIVGAVWAIAAAALMIAGRRRIETMEPGPRATAHELKEDQRWLKSQTS